MGFQLNLLKPAPFLCQFGLKLLPLIHMQTQERTFSCSASLPRRNLTLCQRSTPPPPTCPQMSGQNISSFWPWRHRRIRCSDWNVNQRAGQQVEREAAWAVSAAGSPHQPRASVPLRRARARTCSSSGGAEQRSMAGRSRLPLVSVALLVFSVVVILLLAVPVQDVQQAPGFMVSAVCPKLYAWRVEGGGLRLKGSLSVDKSETESSSFNNFFQLFIICMILF